MPRFRISPRLAVALIPVILLLVFLLLADPLFNLDFGLITDKTSSSSSLIALAGRDLMRLNTVEAIYKIVFPYDYVPARVSWKRFLERAESRRPPLSELEERYLAVYRLAKEIGIEVASKRGDFVVLTVIAKIGFDFDRLVPETGRADADSTGPISLRSDGVVVVDLPPVGITELIIDDSSRADYEYPDLRITPDGWKRLSAFVSADVAARLREDGLFDQAEVQARRFLRQFFYEAGYETVKFSE